MIEKMKQEINIPFILDCLKNIGNEFLKDFKKSPIPTDEAGFYMLFQNNEERCLTYLKEQLAAEFETIPFADGEFEKSGQENPLVIPEYWVCDAMDGAVQYIQHLPGWTINIVLVKDGEPYFAAIFDPLMNEMFWAEKGRGAYLNGQKLSVSPKRNTRFIMAAFDHSSSPEKTPGLNQRTGLLVKELLEQYAIVRNFGPHGLQLASIGAGRIDVFCEEGLDTYNWLPGILIAREAGARISTTDGREWSWGEDSLFVAAPDRINDFIDKRLSKPV